MQIGLAAGTGLNVMYQVCALQDGETVSADSTCGNEAGWDPAISGRVGKYKERVHESSVSLDDQTWELTQWISRIVQTYRSVDFLEYQWLLAAFVDDVCMEQSTSRQAAAFASVAGVVFASTLFGPLEPGSAWLAVYFCSDMQ